jgi:predicted sugar kinase
MSQLALGAKHLSYINRLFLLVKILYQNPHNNADSDNFYISIPKDWSGGADDEVTVIVDDVCVVVPQTIAGATGELIVLRLLEAMIEGDVIDAGDVQKAVEHIL